MAIQTVSRNNCDRCGLEIHTANSSARWVNAMVYGKTFHEACLKNVNGLQMLRLLELDDITFDIGEETGVKVCYAIDQTHYVQTHNHEAPV